MHIPFKNLGIIITTTTIIVYVCIMPGKCTRGRRRIQLVDDLLGKKNYADRKKAVEDMSNWRTIRRDCHTPTQ